mmetsp:Transcript_826/g.2138  ORF Transcript_826/g.2138 Transcript_826/m.2138 type:complete len:201 (+) Transcript_826:1188-1790(+)
MVGRPLGLTDGRNSAPAHVFGGDGDLKETLRGAGQRLFEQIQRVVVIEYLDGLAQGDKLLGAHLGPLIPLGSLGLATQLQLCEVLLVRGQSLRGIVGVLFALHDLHAELANLLRLRLDCRCLGYHLPLLRRHELRVRRDGILLRLNRVRQVLPHAVIHLLQDTHDLPACGRVVRALRAREECEDGLPVVLLEEVGARLVG